MGSPLAENVGYLCTGYPLRRLMKLSVVLGLPFGVFCMYAGYDAFVVDRQPLEGSLWILANSMFLVTGVLGIFRR